MRRRKLFNYIARQGICHQCFMGYYYPGGDAGAAIGDGRDLRCVACGYPETDSGQLDAGVIFGKDCLGRMRFGRHK